MISSFSVNWKGVPPEPGCEQGAAAIQRQGRETHGIFSVQACEIHRYYRVIDFDLVRMAFLGNGARGA
ncbi:hypothetical protein [Paraburkholderia sacchari]|uniref:hypothetical protein n=1 Tax=Paraburkholderia sacchari TaxID=159450 RepID=UPI003D954CDC